MARVPDQQPNLPKVPTSGSQGSTGGSSGSNASVVANNFTVASGLFDATNSQYPIAAAPGVLGRSFQYTGPLVLLTDTFTGSFNIISNNGTTTTIPISVTNQTLAGIASAINSAASAYCSASVIQLGVDGYLTITFQNVAVPGATQDTTLTLSQVALIDNADPYLNFQFTVTISNSLGLQTNLGYQWAVGVRDTITGHLSNMSPVALVQLLNYPSEANLTIHTPTKYETVNQRLEVYRTVNGGSNLLFLGYATWQSSTTIGGYTDNVYTFRDTYNDAALNGQLVGPINEENDPPPDGLIGLVEHAGHLWGFVGNKVYFSGGPDTTNGDGNQAWPPSNYFQVPGQIITLTPTAWGLLVFLRDDIHMVRGVDTASFFSGLWLAGFGVSNKNAVTYDGQTLYVYTTKQQLHAIAKASQDEIGFPVGDVFLASFPATTTNLTMHRGSSLDTALYVSNGSNTILRYDPRLKAWSAKSQPLMGAGRVKSLETAIGVTSLLMTQGASVYQRNTSIWSDNGSAYPAFATIGTIQVADPGTVHEVKHVALQLQARGTLPTISLLNNEINPNVVPFTSLGSPVPDPPSLPASQTLWAYRWYLKGAASAVPMWVNTMQIQITFATEAAQNEVLGVYIRDQDQ